MKTTYLTSLGLLAFVSSVITAPGAIVLDMTNGSGTFAGSIGGTAFYEVGSLTDGSPTEAGDSNMRGRIAPTGSLTDVANADTFSFTYDTFAASTLTGSDLTATNVGGSVMASNGNGIASADGDINGSNGRGIFFQFDLSSLTSGYGLRITDAVSALNSGTSGDLQILVGSSTLTGGSGGTLSGTGLDVTTLGGLSGSGLSIDITDGDYVYFRNAGADRIRLSSLTFEAYAIPEPSAAILGGLGALLLLRRRRG